MSGCDVSARSCSVVVAGIGSPLLRDATAGCRAVMMAEKLLGGNRDIAFKELPAGGFDLIYELEGYRRAIIIAGRNSETLTAGVITETVIGGSFNSIGDRWQLPGGHGIDLFSLLALGRQCGYTMPDPVIMLGVCGKDMHTLDDQPTEAVAAALNRIEAVVAKWITQWGDEPIRKRRSI